MFPLEYHDWPYRAGAILDWMEAAGLNANSSPGLCPDLAFSSRGHTPE
jgi:hypothetical protein